MAHRRRSRASVAGGANEQARLSRRRETPHKYIGVDPAVTDASNDPEAATIERGMALLEAIVERVAARAGRS